VAKVENLDRRLDVIELGDWLRAIGVHVEAFLKSANWPRKL
jgi:hypothetical protein